LHGYLRGREQGCYRADAAQQAVLVELEALYRALMQRHRRERALLRRLGRACGLLPPLAVRGLYLWGGVGRGKTCLADLLHESLPFAAKQRLHFHRFMLMVHERLHAIGQVQDPLRRLAARLGRRCRVLFLDEFHVSDIGDAMLLGRLLEALFADGITLVATSNQAPAELYRDGLQRDRFLPAIALLEQHTRVVHLGGDEDYRLDFLERTGVYFDEADRRRMAEDFRRLAPHDDGRPRWIELQGRRLRAERSAGGVAWFEFEELCAGPRSAVDYLQLARLFQTLLISGVPCFDADGDDAAKRFIVLVDTLYDRNVRLVLSAAAAPEALYRGRRHAEAFVRTASRLREMRSHAYLARAHRP